MKTIIAGSRNITDAAVLATALAESGWASLITEVVCGGARGADRLGQEWAVFRDVPIKYFHADWDTHGKAAGPIRNRQMANYADALIALWDGRSRGTANMIDEATKRGLRVHVWTPTPEPTR